MRGGKRPGAGRTKGKKDKSTLEKEAVLSVFRQKVMKSAETLRLAQMHVAVGQTFLYKIEKEVITGPKGGKSIRSKPPKQVTEQWEIEMFLNRKVEEMNGEAEPLDREDTYYFITAKEPSVTASDSLLDRTFGRSVQAVEMSGPGGKQLFGDEERTKSKQAISQYLGANIGKGGSKGN